MLGKIQWIRSICKKCNTTPCSNVRNNHFFKARASVERPTSNARHTIGDGDRCKARASPERSTSNALHAVGDGDRGKARAAKERTFFNPRHAIGNGERGKGYATIVSITNYLSELSLLNGRKVKT